MAKRETDVPRPFEGREGGSYGFGQPFQVLETKDLRGGRQQMTINLGPQHPATHGVLRVIVTLDGETVIRAQPEIGYLHRNWEKISENLGWQMIVPFSDRNDYLSAITNELVYCLAVEKVAELEVPERGQYLRTIVTELQRILSHLIWFGAFGMDVGATTAFLYAWRERELLYDIFQKLTGARMLYGFLRVGGCRNDTYDGFEDDVLDFLDYFEDEVWPQYDNLLVKNRIFRARTQGVGPLTAEEAIAFAGSGPMLRGSGIDWDLRRDDPYLIYDRFDFDVCVHDGGDAYARTIVRMNEMLESAKIVRQALEQMPDGPVLAKGVGRRLKVGAGEAFVRNESPRGEVAVYLVSEGKQAPYRIKWRAPSFVHLQLLDRLSQGDIVSDVIVNIGTIDIVLGEVDR